MDEPRLDHNSRVMLLAPHPDDETLAAGGLLQRACEAKADVRVLFLTSGQNNPWGQRLFERRLWITPADQVRYGRLRRQEAAAALATLGITPGQTVWLGYEDQGLTGRLVAAQTGVLAAIAGWIAGWRPSLLVVPSPMDLHGDHSAAGVLASLALDTLPADRRPRWLEYLVHTRRPPQQDDRIVTLPLSADQQDRKRRAILCHESQVAVRPRRLLAMADATERFLLAPDPKRRFGESSPVRSARLEDGQLHLELALHAGWGAFGPVTLLLVAWEGMRFGMTVRLRLPRAARRTVPVQGTVEARGSPGHSGTFQTYYHGERRGGRLRLPLERMQPLTRLWLKPQRRFGFLDEAGWCEVL